MVATAASVRLDPGATAAPGSNKGKKRRQQQTPKQRRSKPAALPSPSASPVPPSGASSAEGTSGGGGGGGGGVRDNRRGTAKRSGRGVTRQAKKQPRRGVVAVGKDKEATKNKPKANEKKGGKPITGSRKPARLTSDPPLRLSRQGRSDFDFDLTDDEIDMDDNGSTESAPRKGSAQQQPSKGSSSRRTSATPGAARPGRKRARDDEDAGEKSALAKQGRKSSGRCGRNPQEELVSTQAAAPLQISGRQSTTTSTSKNVRRSSTLVANQATSSPRSTSSASGRGGDGALSLSPRGSWHLGALFEESDDNDDDNDDNGVEGDNGDHGVCNWRLSDDENEDEDEVVDLPKRKQRRSAGRSGAAAITAAGSGKKKKGRAIDQGGGGRGGGVDSRGGSKTRPSTGGGSSGGDGGGDEGGDEAAKSGWADSLPPPAFIEGGKDSSAGSGSPSAGDQAVLEALKAQFKKVDSFELKISS